MIKKIWEKIPFGFAHDKEACTLVCITGSKKKPAGRDRKLKPTGFDSLFIGDCRRCAGNLHFYRRLCGAGTVRGWAVPAPFFLRIPYVPRPH